MRRVFHTLLLLWAAGATAAPFEMQFVGADGKAYAGVVVTLRSTDTSRALAKPAPATMNQLDLQFSPHVLVVPVGSLVSFPNGDSVSHQVYSFSPTKRFDLPLYRGKANAPRQAFDTEGLATLGCNIHDQMRAYVYVVEAQYYARADHEGRWSVADVVPGEYTLTIWHPRALKSDPVLQQRVTVKEEGTKLTLRAAKPLKLRSETQVPGNWDAY